MSTPARDVVEPADPPVVVDPGSGGTGRRLRVLALVVVVLVAAGLASATTVLLRHDAPRTSAALVSDVQRLSAGSQPVTDAQGRAWISATGLVGGVERQVGRPVQGTASPELYQHFREGLSGWDVAVPTPGRYAIDLLVAEFDATRAGQRTFDVVASSGPDRTVLARSLDLAAGGPITRARHVTGLITVASGSLHLDFAAVEGKPVVSALMLTPVAGEGGATVVHDDFNGQQGTLPAGWVPSLDKGATGDRQAYTSLPANAGLDGAGNLTITARHDPYFFDGGSAQYTSARLVSASPISLDAGRMQLRLLVPEGLALDASVGLVRAANGAAYDIFATNGAVPRRGSVGLRGGGPTSTGQFTLPNTVAGTWHVVTADIQPGAVSVSVDGVGYLTVADVDQPVGQVKSSGGPVTVSLALAVRKRVGSPTSFPARLLVDDLLITS